MAITELNYKKLLYKDGNSSPIFNKVNNLTFALNWSRSNNASLENWFVGTASQANYSKNLRILKLLNGQSFKGINSFYNAFQQVYNLTDIYTENWDLSNATNLASMFSGSSKLKNIYQIENWNVSKVINLSSTFASCNFTTLNLENWDTSNVINMSWIFRYSNNITMLNISTWNTSKVNDLSSAFYHLDKLSELDISNWNTSNVENLAYTFFDCGFNETVNLINWDISKVNNLANTFEDCSIIKNLDLSTWNTKSVINMYGTFRDCYYLQTLNLSNWHTENVMNMDLIFYNCNCMTSLNINNWQMNNITNLDCMFLGCQSLSTINVSGWNTINFNNITSVFQQCNRLTTLDVSNWHMNNVTVFLGVFQYCKNLTALNVSNWNMSKVSSIAYTFGDCQKLVTLDVSNWNTSNLTTIDRAFYNCYNLTTLNVSNWNVEKICSIQGAFLNCSNLMNLNFANWHILNVNNLSLTFSRIGHAWNYIKDAPNGMYVYFNGSDLDGITNWDFSEVTNMYSFLNNANCGIRPLYKTANSFDFATPLSNVYWRTDKVTDMSYAFTFNSYIPYDDYDGWTDPLLDTNAPQANWFFNFNNVRNAIGTFSANSYWIANAGEDPPCYTVGADYLLYINNTDNLVNAQYMFAMNKPCGFSRDDLYIIPTFNIQTSILNFNKVSNAAYLFYNYQPINTDWQNSAWNWDTEMYEWWPNNNSMKKTLPTLILNNVRNLAFAYSHTRTPIDTTYWNLSKVTNLAQMCAYCNILDNASLINIAQALLTATNMTSGSKNLYNNYSYSPFRFCNRYINNTTVGTDLVTQLRTAGWYVPE